MSKYEIGKVAPTYRGNYETNTNYNELDIVELKGGSYIARKSVTGVTPGTDDTSWGLIANQGPKGDKGDQGLKGDRGPQGSMGPAGDKGDQGQKGDKGDKGDVGPAGKDPTDELEAVLNNKLAQISSVPETFVSVSELKKTYPSGKAGLFVVADTGHKYIWSNSTWTDAGAYQSVGIADGAVSLTKISPKTVDILASQSQNYDETAISLGYKRFISFPVEDGGINYATGNDIDNPASIRSKLKINFEFNNLLFIIKDPNLRVRLLAYNQNGTFETLSKWGSDKATFAVDTSKLYRIEINTIDDTALDLEYGYSACKVVYRDEKISNFDTLEDKLTNINNTVSNRFNYEENPTNFGYNQFNIYEYEYGGINSSTGNDSASSDSIRTPKNNLITFDSAVTVINLAASKYRIKFVAYNTDGGIFDAGLWWNANKNTFTLDLSKQFRIQIATMDGSAIDLEKALQNIKIVYADNLVANIPRYWQKYLDTRISEVKPELSKGTDLSTMLITTDTHFTFNNVNEINPAVAKYICDKMGIGTLLHLGDTIAENESKSIATERMNYVMSKYRDASDNFYAIRGNHDDNNEGGLYPYSSCITQKESYSWMFRRNNPRVVMGETGTYYYVDNEFEKTRMIFLDVIDFPYADDGSNKIKEKYLAWGIKQLDWFANKALKVPEGYTIAIFNHTPIVESIVTREHGISESRQTLPKNAQQMIEILEAYVTQSKKDITINLTDVNSFKYFNGVVSVDFTQSTGKIIGWFCGHEHIDDIQDIESTGIKNVIILNNSSNFSSKLISSTYQPERKMFDITEEVYDILIIDKSLQKVTLERFGAGNEITRSFNY